jgi:hypothetical protein
MNGSQDCHLGPDPDGAASAPISKADLLELLKHSRSDPTFAADIAALTDETTDYLDPLT